MVGDDYILFVTDACRQRATDAGWRGVPDPEWLRENLTTIQDWAGIDLLLVCGTVARGAFDRCLFHPNCRIEFMPRPAARAWTAEMLERTKKLLSEETCGIDLKFSAGRKHLSAVRGR